MSTATITTTIEMNDVHNYRTADMSDVLGHEVHGAIDGLKTARAMAHALAEPFPWTLTTWPTLKRSVNSRAEPSTPGGRSRS
ncbi:MAG: hypothetical protein OXF79_09060 [Chloroflexi bacterium]|nr:hypothetical protein [Chloroflexota bacterium]